jgi:outer membrane beta-barrel protein
MKTPRLGPTTIFGQLLLALAPIVSVPALADEEAPATDAPDAEEAPAEGDTEEAASDTDAAKPEEAPAVAIEKPVVEETVFVVQGKRFLSQGRFELTPQIAQSVNDQFTSHTGVLVSGLYHLKENVAVEATVGVFGWWDQGGTGPRLGGRDTDLTVELRQKEQLAPERVKLYQFPFIAAGNLQWSPLYGKVNVSDLVLGQFNLYLSVGAGVAGLQLETLTPGPADKTFVPLASPIALTTTFGGGLRFYFTDWLGVRVEVRDYVMPLSVFQSGVNAVADADAPTFDVTNLVLTQLGVSVVF